MAERPTTESSRGEDAQQRGALAMRSDRDGETHVIALSGEMDLSTVDLVEQELLRVEATDAARIVLDLSELEFLDSTGVRLIYMADVRSRQDSDRLRIRRGPDKVQRLFVMTDLADRLPFVD
ncbi:MAG TPA: STAS domain-containing protein [Solirubrobacteraceae bacterium]|nr:STAS domain-containing protein [Solirubrobacteraceae bacterium]